MRSPRIAALAVALLLSGCQLAPDHVRPVLPTAPGYPVYGDSVVIGQRAAEIGWRDFFADPQLEQLVATALDRNRDLAVAIAQIEEARGLNRIQEADRLPTLGSSAEAIRSRISSGASGFPGAAGSTTFTRYSVGVGVSSFELDFWGRVRNLAEASRAQYFATIEARRAVRLILIRDVAAAYFASREAAERIMLADATLRSRQEGLRIARRRMDAGVTSALDFRQAESLLTQAETELAALRLAKARSDNLLAVLVGGSIPEPLPPPLMLARQKAGTPVAEGLPSELLVARPDILAAEERLRAARANIGAARAAFFPTISLTGNAGFASTSLGGLFGSDGFTWSFGPTISLPIFDWGRRQGDLTVARARENIAVATYERTVQEAFREVADALAGRRWLSEQVAAQLRATHAQREIARIARLRYREGVANYLEVLDAERNLFTAEQALIALQRAELDNLVSLYVALGGGSIERDGEAPPARPD